MREKVEGLKGTVSSAVVFGRVFVLFVNVQREGECCTGGLVD